MTDAKPSLSDRLEPAREALVVVARFVAHYLAVGARLAAHYTVVAARKTWVVLQRLPIAVYSFVRALSDADYARRLTELYIDRHSSLPSKPAPAPAVAPSVRSEPQAVLQSAGPDSALVLLSLLQKEGRFVDFLQEDVSGYSDQEVGAAARVVHEGCQRVLRDHLSIEPVRQEAEGSSVTLPKGFDPAAVRPTGNVIGEPPFTGSLVHRGWRAVEVRLPKVSSSRDVRILAAAEVEL
jgi:hypothetical protein